MVYRVHCTMGTWGKWKKKFGRNNNLRNAWHFLFEYNINIWH
uniref:Uncharacterized protein n=1 Tax=Pseudomonas aeruginosa TaxID=287 RepID=A0A7S6K6Z7_PSEAI|nr:hypothetical protein [Pseudomonas aeruginosa]